MPRTDMTKTVDHAEIGQDAAADRDILEQGRIDARQ